MPYEKHTTRHLHDVAVDYDKDLVKELVNKRWHVYEKRPLTDASELFRVMRKVVYSDETRLKAVQSLLQTHPKLIVFYNFDYELEILRTLNSSSLTEIQTHQHSVQNNSKATDDAKNNPNGSKDLTTESSQLSTKLRTLANTQSSDSQAESQLKVYLTKEQHELVSRGTLTHVSIGDDGQRRTTHKPRVRPRQVRQRAHDRAR
jgi:hypothetical protein